ncbi:protein dj-1beta-like [Venturia canescens]|uniref:protein dj-1beta-like n=1 Tax=Venturia canescens TaxID=32260 RepID=UPI001C9C9F25|nr:protein dj-1beta-like [Venturia canescens]
MMKIHFNKLRSYVTVSFSSSVILPRKYFNGGGISSITTAQKNYLHWSAANIKSRPLFPETRQFCLYFLFKSSFKSFISLAGETMATKSAILLLADGAEEMEAVITADVLRRAGIDVMIASITGNESVKCSRNVTIVADAKFDAAIKDRKYDVVILPGGLEGSKALAKSTEVGTLLKAQEKENRIIAAICAAPTALKAHGIAKGKKITSYPSMKEQLTEDYQYLSEKVVVDGNLITSQGPATAYNFGLAIVEKLLNKETALKVASGLLFGDYK